MYILKKYKKDGILHDYPRSGQPRIIDETWHDRINGWLRENSELTANDILHKLHAGGKYV